MLTPEETQKLSAALVKAYPDYDSLRAMVTLELGWALNTRVSGENLASGVMAVLEWGNGYDDYKTLLTKLRDMQPERSRTLRQLSADLLEQVTARSAASAAAAAAAWYASPNPFGTCFVQGRAPFIDRGSLRTTVERDLRSGHCRVLVVNGDPGTGKTFSLRYLSYLASDLRAFGPAFRIASMDLKRKRSSQVDVQYVVETVIAQVGEDPEKIPRQNGQNARWGEVLAGWLDSKARDAGQVWCIVLDGFDSPLLPDEVRSFINHLAERAMLGANLRVVLLSYPVQELPPDAVDITFEETLGIPTLTDLEDFFESLHKHMNRTVDRQQLGELARAVVGALPVPRNDPAFLRALAQGVRSKVFEIFP
jgi:effector-associated domain 1 (EAD1)-containing protein